MWTRKEKRGQEGLRAIEDKKDGGANRFAYQIVDYTTAPAPAQPVPSCNFPHLPTPLHALDIGSETRYVRRQGRSLRI